MGRGLERFDAGEKGRREGSIRGNKKEKRNWNRNGSGITRRG